MKRLTFILLQLLFLYGQVTGCDYTTPTKLYTGEVIAADTLNGKQVYLMVRHGFTFIASAGEYKNGDTVTIEQKILYKRKYSIGL